MKSTTFQQKLIFSAKLFVCAFVIGALGWLSFMPSATPRAGAADVVLSVNISYSEPTIDATGGGEVGREVPVSGDSYNVGSVDVYVDMDGDGKFSDGDMKLDGSITVNNDGTFSGTVYMPNTLPDDEYTLIVVGHARHEGGYNNIAQDTIIVNYKNDKFILPGIPDTGIFKMGSVEVTTKTVMFWGGLIIILAAAVMLIMIIKTPKNAYYNVKSGSSKKRSYSKKKATPRTSKKKVSKKK